MVLTRSPMSLFTLHHCFSIRRLLASVLLPIKTTLVSTPWIAAAMNIRSKDPLLQAKSERVLMATDAMEVLKKLRMWEGDKEEETLEHCEEVMKDMLEEKEASEGELWEAFRVFDRSGEGYVTAAGVWDVMGRLGLREGFGLRECRRMVEAFDDDGDGRICFLEFKKMMEGAR